MIFVFRISGGGRIRDAVRSLICSQRLFGTKEVMIIHHTDCGFTYFSNNDQVITALKVCFFISI
jgi:carbonic anhydrase